MTSGWRISPTHEPETGDALARWHVLRKASPYGWDDRVGGVWHRVPSQPRYLSLVEALSASGRDPDAIERPEHDAVLEGLRTHAAAWSVTAAAGVFVAGLWSAPAAWRCPLPGLLLAQSLPDHQYTTPSESESAVCAVCGFRMEIAQTIEEWAYRLTDGTPLDGVPTGYAQALGWLGHLDVERPTPSG